MNATPSPTRPARSLSRLSSPAREGAANAPQTSQSRVTTEDRMALLGAKRVTSLKLKMEGLSIGSSEPATQLVTPLSAHDSPNRVVEPSSNGESSTSFPIPTTPSATDRENDGGDENSGVMAVKEGTPRLKKNSRPSLEPLRVSTNGGGLVATSESSQLTEEERAGGPSTSVAERSTKRASKEDLDLLVLSSALTEFSMSIQDCLTGIFEIQELRHTTAHDMTPSSSTSSPKQESSFQTVGDGQLETSKVDSALMRLERRLEEVSKEYDLLKSQIKSSFSGSEVSPLVSRKWEEVSKEWESTQRDADNLSEELKEDKWLTVFRTVSGQAEDMMTSLEKVLKQSHEFIWGLQRRSSKSSSSSSVSATSNDSSLPPLQQALSDPTLLPPLQSTFAALNSSLHAKIKYYSPACDRVLKILGKGIADRSTKNGEVLRRFGEMKTRWRNLGERMSRIEREMKGVEDLLNAAAVESGSQESGVGEIDETGDSKRGVFGKLKDKISGRTTPSSAYSPSSSPPTTYSYSSASTMRQSQTSPTLSRGSKSSAFKGPPSVASSSTSNPSPSRPPRNDRRLDSGPRSSQPSTSRDNTQPPPPLRSILSKSATPAHRHSQSDTLSPSTNANRRAVSPMPSSSAGWNISNPMASRRAISPTPSAGAEKPRWNISTRRVEDSRETLRSTSGSSRLSLASAGLRTSSRMSRGTSGGGVSGRVSPAFSNSTFSETSSTWTRGGGTRSDTPSRIPVLGSPGTHGPRRSTTPFSSLNDPEPTSLLQRTMTPVPPNPLSSSTTSTATTTTSRSRLPLPSPGFLSPPRATSPTPSSVASSYHDYRRNTQTPEPRLIAQAQKMFNIRPPPVPSLPLNLRSSTTTPRPSGVRRPSLAPTSESSRPVSSMDSNTRAGAKSPYFGDSETKQQDSQAYIPDPLDPLDVRIAAVVNYLPIMLTVERVDKPLARELVGKDGAGLSAKYFVGVGTVDKARAVMCKIVDKVGPRVSGKEKKVLVRKAGGWMDLEQYCLAILQSEL